MISDVSAWAALAGALLSIGVEIWKLRPSRRARSSNETEIEARDQSNLPPFFRGVTPVSFIPIAALILAAQALGLYSDELLHDSKLATNSVDALQLVSGCTFIRTAVTLIVFVTVVLVVRALGHYFVRVVKYSEEHP